ncbi:hypothetical protein PENTCL1PPCAC_3715, partial [Pristionchus entomophagus]
VEWLSFSHLIASSLVALSTTVLLPRCKKQGECCDLRRPVDATGKRGQYCRCSANKFRGNSDRRPEGRAKRRSDQPDQQTTDGFFEVDGQLIKDGTLKSVNDENLTVLKVACYE